MAFRKVVFLDRDGVINYDSPDYIKSWAEFVFLPNTLSALSILHQNKFQVIITTNQSAIGRKLIAKNTLNEIHHRLIQIVSAHGGKIHDIFFCPHHPDDVCSCRKPRIGLLEQAVHKYNIDLADTTMVGDSATDMECAQNAGCGRSVLVLTGKGTSACKRLDQLKLSPDYIARDLFAAVQWIVDQPLTAGSLGT